MDHFTFWIKSFANSKILYTHRPQGVIIVGIYMSSDIYYLLLLYLNRKELGRQLGSQTSNHDNFVKLSRLASPLACITPFSFSIIIIINILGHVNAHDNNNIIIKYIYIAQDRKKAA